MCKLEGFGDISEGAIVCSIEFSGLYPHIPQKNGMWSMKEMLGECKNEISDQKQVPLHEFMDLTILVFKDNYFQSNNKICCPKLCTAFGGTFAPSFANTFKSGLDREVLRISPKLSNLEEISGRFRLC